MTPRRREVDHTWVPDGDRRLKCSACPARYRTNPGRAADFSTDGGKTWGPSKPPCARPVAEAGMQP